MGIFTGIVLKSLIKWKKKTHTKTPGFFVMISHPIQDQGMSFYLFETTFGSSEVI